MIELIGTIAAVLAISGVVLNNYKNRTCFVLWMVSNAAFAGIHYGLDLRSAIFRDVVFFGLAIHGFIMWSKKKGA